MKTIYIGKEDILVDDDFPLEKEDLSLQVSYNGAIYVRLRYLTLAGFIMRPPVGHVVDHINRNTLDNRRCNLQVLTQSQNIIKNPSRVGISGLRNISPRHNKFRVRISYKKKRMIVGLFDTLEKALVARNKAYKDFGLDEISGGPLDPDVLNAEKLASGAAVPKKDIDNRVDNEYDAPF